MNHIPDFKIVGKSAAHPFYVIARHNLRLGFGRGNILDTDAQLVFFNFQNHCRKPRIPQFDISGHNDIGKRRAPAFLAGQILNRNLFTRASPTAQTTVIFLQCALQGIRSLNLHFGINRRTDRQTTIEKLVLTKILAQLATNFIGKVIARRTLAGETLVVSRLHRLQWLFACRCIVFVAQIAVLHHLSQHKITALHRAIIICNRIVTRWRLGQHSQIRRLASGLLKYVSAAAVTP